MCVCSLAIENSEHSKKLGDLVPTVQFVIGGPTDETALRSAFAGTTMATAISNAGCYPCYKAP
ncbi:hypothetical protein MKX08_008001 [Trichoderma sp. CBMAI-0020]|nr:hypothetical protein MKX08_008001 [Trichoderma sp. CBMAI-0020]